MKRTAARPTRPIELVTPTMLAAPCSIGDEVELALPALSAASPAGVAVEPPLVESPPVELPESVSGTVPESPALVSPPAELAGTAAAASL